MEDGLVLAKSVLKHTTKPCLNPYCSGRWSRTSEFDFIDAQNAFGLNPYCSGRWSRTV